MAQVKVTAERNVHAPVEQVADALADYREFRPKLLTEHFSEYQLREGGYGEGTLVRWKLHATRKRVRDCLMQVSRPERAKLVETDKNSSMVTVWTVTATDDGRSTVQLQTTWEGAGGIGGFFEKTFAPAGLRKIYHAMLDKLEEALPHRA